jgi:hypothetical protein
MMCYTASACATCAGPVCKAKAERDGQRDGQRMEVRNVARLHVALVAASLSVS